MTLTGENQSNRRKKHLPMTLCALQISHGLTRNKTRGSRLKLTYVIHTKIKSLTHRERIMLPIEGITA